MKSKRITDNFGDVIREELTADRQLAEEVAAEFFHASVARQVYGVRQQAGLTQKQLADLIDTQQSVISRIEDADYDGHSLTALLRIAFAMNKELRIEFADPPTAYDEIACEEFPIDWAPAGKWPQNLNLNGAGGNTLAIA